MLQRFMAWSLGQSKGLFFSISLCFPNDDVQSPLLQKLLHRDQTLKRTDALTDGQQLALVYDLNNERGAKGTICVSAGCLVYEPSLALAESVLFSVPLIHFKKGADIAVQFRYAFEDQRVLLPGNAGHFIFFWNSSPPKEVRAADWLPDRDINKSLPASRISDLLIDSLRVPQACARVNFSTVR